MSIIQQLPDRFDHALFAVWIAKVRLVMTQKQPTQRVGKPSKRHCPSITALRWSV